jgi:hypothetical protein
MKKKKKKKQKLHQNHLTKNQTKIPMMLSRKYQHQKVWKKPILDHYWLEVLKPGIMEVEAVIIAQEDLAKTSLTLDHGTCTHRFFANDIILVTFLFLDTVLMAINHRRRTKAPGNPTPQQVVVSTRTIPEPNPPQGSLADF